MLQLPLADPGVPDTRAPWRFLLWLARGQRRVLTTGAVFGVIWMVSQALIPLALGAALGAVVRRDRHQIVAWAVVVLALGLLQAAAGVLRHRRAVSSFLICASRVQQLVARKAVDLGGDLARKVESGEVANLGASDVERIGDALDVVARFTGAVFSYAVVATVLLVASPPLGAIVVLGVPVAVLAILPVMRPFERRQTIERDRRTDASSVASDTVSGLRVLRGLGGERVFSARYERASQDVASASMRTANLQAILDGAQVLLPGAIVVAVTWIGAHLAVNHSISAGDLVAFYASAAFLVLPMQTFVEAAGKWTAAVVASRRILAVFAIERSIPLGPDSLDVEPTGQLIDDRTGTVIEPRLLTAVIPATPEEGTALVDRIARWLPEDDQDGGRVRWGDRLVTDLPLAWFRDHVMALERSPFHLKGDLASTGGMTHAALVASQSDEVVEALPDGQETELSEGWRTLSGGQRQRLSLAQVLAAAPEVLILDDPTSAVDAHTEAAIAESLTGMRRGLTTVVVTTSPLVAERADRVVLLAGGAIAAGTHEQLMRDEPRYEAVVVRGAAL